MKKKILQMITQLCLLLSLTFIFVPAAKATERTIDTTCEYLPDGSCIITTTTIASNLRASGNQTAYRTRYYTAPSGERQWSVTVTGSFTYNGTSSQCTHADVHTEIYNSSWEISCSSASRNENTATATATAQKIFGGSISDIKTISVSLSCDPNGNIF